jgi:hypothetical protein
MGEKRKDRMNPFRCLVSGLRNTLSSRRHPAAKITLSVLNPARNTVIATRLEVANSSATRNKGLLGRESLSPGEGLWIFPCEAVHTFWMRFSIDLVYLDRKNRILKLCHAVPPWRLSACLRAHSVLELPAGTLRETLTEPGDTLEFSDAFAPSGVSSILP